MTINKNNGWPVEDTKGINPLAGQVRTDNGWSIEYKGRAIWGYCMDKNYKPLGEACVNNIYCRNVLRFKSVRAAKLYITKNIKR